MIGEPFALIAADPAWRFDNQGTRATADDHYATMKVEDVAALGEELRPLLAVDALLFLWCPSSFVLTGHGARVCNAWGFVPTQLFSWFKITKEGRPRLGMGNAFRNTWEPAIIGTRGRYTQLIGDRGLPNECTTDERSRPLNGLDRLEFPSDGNSTLRRRPIVVDELDGLSVLIDNACGVATERGRHSEKPEIVYDMLDRLVPVGRRCELFARRSRPGWFCIGNELPDGGIDRSAEFRAR